MFSAISNHDLWKSIVPISLIAHALTFFVVLLVVWVLVKGSVLVLMFYLHRP
jgi:hypothetical protein